jgi:predicted transcriptional regulator
MVTKEARSVDGMQAEIEETASRIREVNREIKRLRDERDELLEFRSELQEELLKALGEQLRAAKESES